jgi:prephenate dehydrogenase
MASENEGREADNGPFARIAIVGFGLIGASIALAARARWPASRLIAIDRGAVVDRAMRMRAADVAGEDLALTRDADLVVLAAPVLTNIRILSELTAYVGRDTIITDVGSTKREIASAAASADGLSFVGGHPLAGAAIGGVESARGDLFENRPWILAPAADRPAVVAALSAFVRGLGARVHLMTPDAHDAVVAYLSHLPQLTASALMHLVGERAGADGLALAGRGLSDTTRLASSPVDIWRDISATNGDNIGRAVDELIAILLRLKAAAAPGDDAIGTTFESAARWKRVLDAGGDRP